MYSKVQVCLQISWPFLGTIKLYYDKSSVILCQRLIKCFRQQGRWKEIEEIIIA